MHWNIHISLQWRHNGCDGVSNNQLHDCLLNRLFRRRSKKTSKLRVTCLCVGNSPVTGEFPAQRSSNAENVSIWWRHHVRAHALAKVKTDVPWLAVRARHGVSLVSSKPDQRCTFVTAVLYALSCFIGCGISGVISTTRINTISTEHFFMIIMRHNYSCTNGIRAIISLLYVHEISFWNAHTVSYDYLSIVDDMPLRWCHNGHDSVSNHQLYDYLLNRLFRRWSNKTSKLRVTGLCAGNSPGTGGFPAQMASNAENVSIWWRHHANAIRWSTLNLASCVSRGLICNIDIFQMQFAFQDRC